jgi:halimadienyl-diphosphate synthase
MDNLIIDLLKQFGPGSMSSLAYDTAWLARLGNMDTELSNHAINWICEHQLSDGSWGVEKPFYYHDRVISTLAAMIVLTRRGRRSEDRHQIEKGLLALERITAGATQGLSSDPNGATVGFEMIAPTLVAEAEQLGIIKQQGERVLGRLIRQRAAKLDLIRGKMINRFVTLAFSSEMAGLDGQHMLDLGNLQEANGSVGHSPSATAYLALFSKPGDPVALNYLRGIVNPDGGVPDLEPFEVYEKAWILWNLSLVPQWNSQTLAFFKPHLDYLNRAWVQGKGVGFSSGYSVPDGDDTIITYDVLSKFGYSPDIKGVLSFEETDHFRCYDLEVGISPSVNIHALMALQHAGYPPSHPTIQKIKTFLKQVRGKRPFWVDKWHSSPYYSTSHYIIACTGSQDDYVNKAVEWILSHQQKNGSWGTNMPTAEETAYCLQALSIWGRNIPKATIKHGISWLRDHMDPPYYPLWIGKGLYSAGNVVRSAILSALRLAEDFIS